MTLNIGLVLNISLVTSLGPRVAVLTRWVKFMDFIKLLGLVCVTKQIIGSHDHVITITSLLECKLQQVCKYSNNSSYVAS